MTRIRTVCVYCGSSTGARPEHMAAAEAMGRALAEAGVGLVYGGGNIGLMGAVARAALAGGGQVTGVIPQFLVEREAMLADVQELVVTADMHERKRIMFERSDAFVALPGGIGTLEELVEQLTWAQLGRHDKPILIADLDGFWSPLLALLDHMTTEGFVRPGLEAPYIVATTVEEILPALERAAPIIEAMMDAQEGASVEQF
ncbi:TIGR00730 family Rossman fold protein [Hansschlegelia plantiphila]|uniref:Cytokinin riboside 5'-monophosphate phosphoribohydrolase n=1 Tax=Hansschlegelia plantiphila TaxID=374655 RepID=A0A9W6J0J7_9HYPH|nr:TIGR00730 family Rossman fold protein [Hansschlegelia plantiphila]GLK67536.1 cytokinin riboside 5'-monophosphate phosphoribohydrolase [Hansschlegelia plantiphila]